MMTSSKPKLSEKKQSWVKGRTVVLHGNKLSYNAAIQQRYQSRLDALIKKMADETLREIKKLFKGNEAKQYFEYQKKIAVSDETIYNQSKKLMSALYDKFSKLFNDDSKQIAKQMVDSSNDASESSLNSSFKKLSGLEISTDFIPKGLNEVINSSVLENVKLISNIPENYFNDITAAVMRSISTGNGLKDLVPYIEKKYSIEKRRARNISIDQSRKAYNNINKQRMLAVGYKKFKWLHSGGGQHPRKLHIAMSGNIYSFDDLPVIDEKTGETGIPGQAINCGCTMTPVYEFENGEQV